MAAYNVYAKFKAILILIIAFFSEINYANKIEFTISNKRLCADKECNVVISKGKALASHLSSSPLMLSFRKDDYITIYSKSAGNNPKLWGGEVNGQRGYFDRNFVRELHVSVHQPQFLINTEEDKLNAFHKHDSNQQEKVSNPENTAAADNVLENKDKEFKEGEYKIIRSGAIDEVNNNEELLDATAEDSESLSKEEVELNLDESSLEEDGSENEDSNVFDEAFWEDLDTDYFESERDRFDTSALNKFVKQKLNVDIESKTEDNSKTRKDDLGQLETQTSKQAQVKTTDALVDKPLEDSPRMSDESDKSYVDSPKPSTDSQKSSGDSLPAAVESHHAESDVPNHVVNIQHSPDPLHDSLQPSVDLHWTDVESSTVKEVSHDKLGESPPETSMLDQISVPLSKYEALKVEPNNSEVHLDDSAHKLAETVTKPTHEDLGKESPQVQTIAGKSVTEEQQSNNPADAVPRPERMVDSDMRVDGETESGIDSSYQKADEKDEKSKTAESRQPSQNIYIDANVFPFEDEEDEEEEIGAEIPVFDPTSVGSRDSKKKPLVVQHSKTAMNAEIPSAINPLHDISAKAEIDDPTHLTESEVRDITAGQMEMLKPNIAEKEVTKSIDTEDRVQDKSKEGLLGQILGTNTILGDDKMQDKEGLIGKESFIPIDVLQNEASIKQDEKLSTGLDNPADESVGDLGSKVRPDTPSGATPEQGQTSDPVTSSEQDRMQVTKTATGSDRVKDQKAETEGNKNSIDGRELSKESLNDHKTNTAPLQENVKDPKPDISPQQENHENPKSDELPQQERVKDHKPDNLPQQEHVKDPKSDELPQQERVKDLKPDNLPQQEHVKDPKPDISPQQENQENPKSDISPQQENQENPKSDNLPQQERVTDNLPQQEHVKDPKKDNLPQQELKKDKLTDNKAAMHKEEIDLKQDHKDSLLATEESESKMNPVDLELFQRDEKDVIPGGFAGFLQPSSQEPGLSDHANTTPSLDLSSVVLDSVSSSMNPAAGIEYTRVKEEKQETGKQQKMGLPDAEKLDTVIVDESTLIFDAEGNFLTAFLNDDLQIHSTITLEQSSPVKKLEVTPTAMVKTSASSATPNDQSPVSVPLESSVYSQVSNSTDPVITDRHLQDIHFKEVYQSSDFSSRKVLSLNSQHQERYTDPHKHDDTHEHDSTHSYDDMHDRKHDDDHRHHEDDHHHQDDSFHHHSHHHHDGQQPSPYQFNNEPLEKVEATASQTTLQSEQHSSSAVLDNMVRDEKQLIHKHPSSEEALSQETPQTKEETSTQPSQDYELPLPPLSGGEGDPLPQDFDSGSIYHSRKMNVNEVPEEENLNQPPPGFSQSIVRFIELPAKIVIEKLPASIQSLLALEPLGLSPVMTVLVALFSISVLLMACLSSMFSSNGKKQKLRATLDVITELEAKLQLAVKENENLEDSIKEFKTENNRMKEEMSKQKKESGKNVSEVHTVQVQNEMLKKQVHDLAAEVCELKESSNLKQGEVKQTNKKTKELEKQLKKLEERDLKIEQENKKLTSELRHKEEELTSLQGKVNSLNEQIGHLQTSKEQLLAEAVDWKEKVSDLKERLEQREEEFKQMQENIMFKENELEVLKDCFLQLKSFEEEEAEVEDGDMSTQRVQEKLKAMMDVSKVNASLRAIEEERNMMSNRLQIESEARKELEEQLENSRRSVESSMADKMKAERQCQEAQTKLNVLSSYFKEKELQLQRELGEHEALKKQNMSKLVSADENSRSLLQEMEILRTQVDSLKRELSSSERDFRSQIAANEKKAHENWLAARAAEREVKEARHEAGIMRQKLTDIERRQFMGPGGLIRPLPTRGMPLPGMINGPPPPPGMDRSPSRGSLPPLPPPHLRDEEFLRRGPPPPGVRPPPPEARSPPLPPFGDARSPPLPRMPPPGIFDGRSPPPFDRRPPSHMLDRRSPPFRLPPPDMLPHPMRGGPLPLPPHFPRGGSPPSGANSPHPDRSEARHLPPYARNGPFPPDRPSPQGPSSRQQQSQV